MILATLGFIYIPDFSQVLLITKQRPIFHKGKLNGLGGKCEGQESPVACISREVAEESDLVIAEVEWQQIGRIEWTEWQVEIFAAIYSGQLNKIRPSTDGPVAWYPTTALPDNIVSNLSWLVPLGIDILKHQKKLTVAAKYLD